MLTSAAIPGISLRHRLLMLTLLTSGIGLLLGCGADLLFELHEAKGKAVEELRSTADLIGTNAAAALAFDDALNGEKLLEALKIRPRIRGAVLYGADGKFFASYSRDDLKGKYLFPRALPADAEWTDEKLTVLRSVVLNQKVLGRILIESDLSDLRERTSLAMRASAAISAGVLLVVYFLTTVLGHSITGPIHRLAETARRVAEMSDYSLRAPPLRGKEMVQLSADFNHMLDEISRRDTALVEARDQLEMRVTERTRELEIEITERERAQIALRQSEEMFRTLSAAAPVGIAQSNAKGKVTYLNPAWAEMTGISAEAGLADGWRKAIHPDDLERLENTRNVAVLQGLDYSANYRFVSPRGVLWVDTIARGIRDKSGKHQGYVSVTQDVTERQTSAENMRRAKDAAEAASRAKSEFLANMSHEIRTPMNGIIGMTELALDTKLDGEQRNYLSMVKSSADALLGIINDILDFSKVEAGRLELEIAPFSLPACIEEALWPLALRAQEKGLELSWSVEADVPEYLNGDATRLRQVLINLCGNAVKFTKKGRVSVRAERLPASDATVILRVTVADTGIGIPPEKHKEIFAAFSQADASTTREFGGTGLGLSISARLAKLMHGEISLDSEPNVGSQFHFIGKFAVVAVEQIPATLSPGPDLKGFRALVVDDNEVNRRLLEILLPSWGMEVKLAANGEDGITLFTQQQNEGAPFSVVLMDTDMPGLSGYQTTDKLRALPGGAAIPVLILMSSPVQEDQRQHGNLRIFDRISKPIRRNELRSALERALCGDDLPSIKSRKSEPAQFDRPLRILLTEDNAVNQKLAMRLLEKMGHRVTLAVHGKEAVEQAHNHFFDVVLMDIQMPVMGGVQAAELIREAELETGRRTPIVAMTAHAMSGDREKYLASGMDGYVSKPIHTVLLREEISRVVQFAGMCARKSEVTPMKNEVSKCLDREELLNRVEHDEELAREILGIFQADSHANRDALGSAVAACNADEVRSLAHGFKGMLANLSANRAAAAAAHLEDLAKDGKTGELAPAWQALETELDNVLLEVQQLLAGALQ